MGFVVRMPQLGMTMEEGTVVEWRAEVGSEIHEDDVITVVESEKTTNDVHARESGELLETFVDPGEPVEPGDPIAYVGDPGESVPDDITEGTEPSSSDDTEAETTTNERTGLGDGTRKRMSVPGDSGVAGPAKISPRARSYARENGISIQDISGLQGTGPDGAIIERNVIEIVDAPPEADATVDTQRPAADAALDGRDIYQVRDASRLRNTIVERMTASSQAPQVTLNRTATVDDVLDLKAALVEDADIRLSVTDFLLAAVVETMTDHPEFNGIYEGGSHKFAANVNIGIAVDIEEGLVTPVIRGANNRSITNLSAERQRLVERAQLGEFTSDDLANGTFTVTNLGHFGIKSFDPLLNPPEVAILGVGDIRRRPDPETGGTRRELGLSLTFDHRAVDGADAARFLKTLVEKLEQPLGLLSLEGTRTEQSDGSPFLETTAGPEGERTVESRSDGGLQATVRSRQFEWAVDEPEDVGGTDTAPNPVEQFVGSLSSCLILMIGHFADRRDMNLDEVTVTAEATPPEGRIEGIDVAVEIYSGAPAGSVREIVEMAERACYVNQIISDDVETGLSVTIHDAA